MAALGLQASRSGSPTPVNPVPAVPDYICDSAADRVAMFWRARRNCVTQAVDRLYQQHLHAASTDAEALASLFPRLANCMAGSAS